MIKHTLLILFAGTLLAAETPKAEAPKQETRKLSVGAQRALAHIAKLDEELQKKYRDEVLKERVAVIEDECKREFGATDCVLAADGMIAKRVPAPVVPTKAQ